MKKQNLTADINAYRRAYYRKNRAKFRKYAAKQKANGYHNQHYAKNAEWIKQQRRKFRIMLKAKVLEIYGMECAFCHDKTFEALQIDHINSDGYKERKAGESANFYKSLLMTEKRSDLRTLCVRCNWLRRYFSDDYLNWPSRTVEDVLRDAA